jgi:tetratricopeptide (TPR) repeat protein
LSQQSAAAIQAGQWERAETLLRQGLETSPDNAEIRHQLAEALWHRGSANEAMSHIAAAARLEPASGPLAVRAGEMALASGAYESALDRAEDAIRLDPRLASAWALRGRAFQKLKNSDRALADLQRSLVFDPDNSATLLEVATIYRSLGEPARCLTTLHHLNDTYSLGDEPQEALMLEGLTLMDLKRPHEAAEVLLAATHRGPANADVLFHLAQAQSAAGQYTDATSTAQQALAIDSTHQASLELLTQLEARASAFEQRHR